MKGCSNLWDSAVKLQSGIFTNVGIYLRKMTVFKFPSVRIVMSPTFHTPLCMGRVLPSIGGNCSDLRQYSFFPPFDLVLHQILEWNSNPKYFNLLENLIEATSDSCLNPQRNETKVTSCTGRELNIPLSLRVDSVLYNDSKKKRGYLVLF